MCSMHDYGVCLIFQWCSGRICRPGCHKSLPELKGGEFKKCKCPGKSKSLTGLQSWLIMLFYPTQNYFKLESLVSARK